MYNRMHLQLQIPSLPNTHFLMMCSLPIHKEDPLLAVAFGISVFTAYTLKKDCLQGMTREEEHRVKIV